jgi:hypothetical protein
MQDMNYWGSLVNNSSGALQGQEANAMSAYQGAQNGLAGAQGQLANSQNYLNNYAGIDYPAMSASGASPSPQQNAAFAAPSAQSQPDNSSRGFNPWSLQGEANSR